jgi:uncharacterized protein YcbK (DUF882 family)
MISLKLGVSLKKLQSQMAAAIPMVAAVYAKYKYDTVITSGDDGKHSMNSLHYVGRALDFRIRHVKSDDIGPIAAELRQALPGYDVVRETTHIHIEYDPD